MLGTCSDSLMVSAARAVRVGLRFYRLVQQVVEVGPVPCNRLADGTERPDRHEYFPLERSG